MANGDRGYRAAPLTDAELASGKLDLRVFVDRGSVWRSTSIAAIRS